MSTVKITIGPSTYPVQCGDGEEAQVERLAELISEKYAQLGTARTPQEAQNLVFTALFLADELVEARKNAASDNEEAKAGGKKTELRAEIETLREENTALKTQISALSASVDESATAAALEALAARAEAVAAALEGAA